MTIIKDFIQQTVNLLSKSDLTIRLPQIRTVKVVESKFSKPRYSVGIALNDTIGVTVK